MQVAGSGVIPAGEYNEKISISGSGRIQGNVRCVALSAAGSASAEGSVWCEEDMKASGSVRIDKSLHAGNVHISGSCHVGEDCTAEKEVKVSGSFRCQGKIQCETLRAAGKVHVGGGVEAEDVRISGGIDCTGLLNAERIEIKIDRASSRVGSIGGSDIKIYSVHVEKKISRLPLLSKLVGNIGEVEVAESIEGDIIAIERVRTPLVVGRIVAVGADCRIDLVQYSENIEIHPDAQVGRYEKIE